jgi:hypothetical protein
MGYQTNATDYRQWFFACRYITDITSVEAAEVRDAMERKRSGEGASGPTAT